MSEDEKTIRERVAKARRDLDDAIARLSAIDAWAAEYAATLPAVHRVALFQALGLGAWAWDGEAWRLGAAEVRANGVWHVGGIFGPAQNVIAAMRAAEGEL